MSSTKKRVVVKTDDLSVGKTRKRNGNQPKLSGDKLKQQFIRKVRALQRAPKPQSIRDTDAHREDESALQETLKFLGSINPKDGEVGTQPLQKVKVKDPPPYSCLKNSDKPTYRQWKSQTLKNKQPKVSPQISVRLDTLDTPPPKRSSTPCPPPAGRVRRKTVKIGKKDGHLSLVIYAKGGQKRRPRSEPSKMRSYLKNRNLLGRNSSAPNDIVRTIFQSSTDAGDVYNKSLGKITSLADTA